jgi:hypothetical protein
MLPFFRNMLMGPGNHSLDAGRVLWVFGALAFIIGALVFQGIAVHRGQPFSMVDFGTGFGGGLSVILGLGGLGVSLKDRGVAKAQATAAGVGE